MRARQIRVDDRGAIYVHVRTRATLAEALEAAGLPSPGPVLVVVGGAGRLDAAELRRLTPLFRDGLVPALERVGAVAVDGGTDAGVMRLLGDAREDSSASFPLVGVAAEGTRTTFTIAAGKIGNDRPIETVYEKWYSDELQMVVFSKSSDPRFGEQTYRLTNINRSEPDPSLFEKPAGYKVVSDARPTTYRLAPTRKVTTVPVKNVATTTVTKP